MVTLTLEECRQAAGVGVERRLRAIDRDRKHRFDWSNHSWAVDIEAAGAEMAYAKLRNRYWADAAEPDTDGDVGPAQIRWTSRQNGCLLIHPEDADDAPFVLVTGALPKLNVVGYIYGKVAKQQRWWRADTGRPAFFVPQHALHALAPACAA